MKETYWDQFMASGRIEDYLNYRMTADRECSAGKTGIFRETCGKEQRESDRTYRDGALHHAHRRI